MTLLAKSDALHIPEPLSGESLTSWVLRAYNRLSVEKLNSFQLELDYAGCGYVEADGSECDIPRLLPDLDLLENNVYASKLLKDYNICESWLEKRFRLEIRPIIPFMYRQSYCYACLGEALQITQEIAVKHEWRFVLQPFCIIHNCVLLDAGVEFTRFSDYAYELFLYHCDRRGDKLKRSVLFEADHVIHDAALKVQRRYLRLREEAQDLSQRHRIDNFMLTILRAVLMPSLHFAYRPADFNKWAGSDAFVLPSLYVRFYQEVFRAPALMRAKALYLTGLVLGWIGEDEAVEAAKDSYFFPRKPLLVWRALDKTPGLLSLMCSDLRLNETAQLSISDVVGLPLCWSSAC
jgi:hypothetical protein